MTDHPFRSDRADPSACLSPQGCARRDAMLADLQRAVTTSARRRRALRAAAVIAPPALAVAAAFAWLAPSPAPRPIANNTTSRQTPADHTTAPTHADTAPAPTRVPAATPAYTMANADFRILSAPTVRIVTAPADVQTISDDELLRILRATGHDVGLIRAGSRVILTDNRPDDRSAEPSSRRDSAPPRASDHAV